MWSDAALALGAKRATIPTTWVRAGSFGEGVTELDVCQTLGVPEGQKTNSGSNKLIRCEEFRHS